MQSPLAGFKPYDNFGWRPQFTENGVTIPAMFHNGADIAAPSGTPIRAARSGVVTWQGWDAIGGGNGVIIGHGAQVSTGYYHMLGAAVVRRGDHVKQGQVIGYVGMSGLATGPHLHFIVWAQGVEIDPYPLITAVVPKPVPSPRGEFGARKMFMIALKTGKDTLFAVVGSSFWLEFTGQDAANNLNKQLGGGPALIVSKSFWESCKRSATVGKNR